MDYLKFLILLKQKMGAKSVSIAASASYWYLKAFPIDRIAKAINYIVYMTKSFWLLIAVFLANNSISSTDMTFMDGGIDSTGQLMRLLPALKDRGAGSMWKRVCFKPSIDKFDENDFRDNMGRDPWIRTQVTSLVTGKKKPRTTKTVTITEFSATVSILSQLSIARYLPVPQNNMDDGQSENKCWPSAIAPLDPGFALLAVDPYYEGMRPPYDYAQPYDPPNNGV
ncbi:hypothetical protein PSPO01_03202 [Paraphaeosphaeria sporulosa]